MNTIKQTVERPVMWDAMALHVMLLTHLRLHNCSHEYRRLSFFRCFVIGNIAWMFEQCLQINPCSFEQMPIDCRATVMEMLRIATHFVASTTGEMKCYGVHYASALSRFVVCGIFFLSSVYHQMPWRGFHNHFKATHSNTVVLCYSSGNFVIALQCHILTKIIGVYQN